MNRHRTFKIIAVIVVLLFLSGCSGYGIAKNEQPITPQPVQVSPIANVVEPPVAVQQTIVKPVTVVEVKKTQVEKKLILDYSLNLNYSETTASSIANASLALKIISGKDGYLLKSGETFSFNAVVGPRTYKRGFVDAPLIKGTGVGGGVCKSSTVMHQAAKAAGMTIVERHNHSKQVQYAKLGTDAMVSYGQYDNRFRNDTSSDVLFVCSMDTKARVAHIKVYKYVIVSVNQ